MVDRYLRRLMDGYITALASALTAAVTERPNGVQSVESPGNTDTAKQARIAGLETAVKAHIHRKRIKPDKALHTRHA